MDITKHMTLRVHIHFFMNIYGFTIPASKKWKTMIGLEQQQGPGFRTIR